MLRIFLAVSTICWAKFDAGSEITIQKTEKEKQITNPVEFAASASIQKQEKSATSTNFCTLDKDCNHQPFYICTEKGVCMHKDVFPIHYIEFIGTIVLPVLVGMANVGGIGGGGLVIPFLMTFWGFTTKEAIAISNMTIAVGAIVRFFMSLKQTHPDKPATNIDYGIVIVMMPLVLVGTIIGILANTVLSSLTLAIILTLLLLFLTV